MGPFVLPLACTLYDESLLDRASVLGGGSGVGSAASTSQGGEPASGADGGSRGAVVLGGGGGQVGSIAGAAGGRGGNAGAVGGVGGVGTSVNDGELVNDMEDSEGQLTVTGGRDGFWFVGNDGTAGGIQVPLAITSVHLRLANVDTHPAGGACVESGSADQLCYDHFGTSVTFSTAWKQHSVLFSALKQTGEGYHPADMKLKPQSLFSVEWSVGKGSPAGKPAEIWIDDVELLKPPATGTCK